MEGRVRPYQRAGVGEYLVVLPDLREVRLYRLREAERPDIGLLRSGGFARPVDGGDRPARRRRAGGILIEVDMNGHVSPLLNIRKGTSATPLAILHPEGRPFETVEEVRAGRGREREARQELEERLPELRIDPDSVTG